MPRPVIFDNDGPDLMDFRKRVISLNNAVNTKTFLSVSAAYVYITHSLVVSVVMSVVRVTPPLSPNRNGQRHASTHSFEFCLCMHARNPPSEATRARERTGGCWIDRDVEG